jgi:GTP cyclohydrolase I
MSITKAGLTRENVPTIADVQGSPDTRRISIDKVGIKDIRHPVRISDRSGGEQHTVATFGMYVELPHNFKGTHMSRFVQILNQHEREISVRTFRHMIGEVAERLEAEKAHIEMGFPYFINKKAPVSGVESLIDYDVKLIGELENGRSCMRLQVQVPVTSLCPCSKEISAYGAHNQRSHVTVQVKSRGFI